MSPRLLRIRGFAPKVNWRKNPGGVKRTIKEAEEIARKNGVRIPDNVVFFEAEPGELKGSLQGLAAGEKMETARGPSVIEHADGYVYWKDHLNRFGKVPFQIHPEVLTCDEAIVAVIAHEMFELSELRQVFHSSRRRVMPAEDYARLVSTDRRDNFHYQAWDAADKVVLRMRKDKRR
jgi:hypothetical protein